MDVDKNIQESDSTAASFGWVENMDDEDNEDLLLLNDYLNLNTSSLRCDEKYIGFDNNAAENWIYPSNFPERAYQFNIVQKALFHNTLVVLPTGLGKTFIAAVVMYNIYRWYPLGKVIFMAPTRPLVSQQIEACCKIVGIPKADSVEITGKLSKSSRAQLWQTKRVFFATPQSVQSDILDAELNFPFEAVKLIVVDEAHKAKGRYAYTEVVRKIWSRNKFFRILALSATPGRRKEDVEEVIRNLFVSHLEVRTEDSVDVVSYVHRRQLKVVVVDLGTKLSRIRDELLQIADPHIRNLIENGLISGRPGSISRNWLVMEHKKFREMTQNCGVPYQKALNSDFNICISVYHAIELLERHGLRVFLNNFENTQDGPKFVIIMRPDLRRLVQRVRDEVGPNPFEFSDQCMLDGQIASIPPNIDFGHPKFEIAREHVLAHFEANKHGRVIIFCEYRESVMLMHRLLLQHRPLIRPRLFVGQGGTGSIRAVTQQQQISVMDDFRSGKSNALIATSVAEEGIDVGEVDLIVCFDINTSNPTRFIQRIGRTGRKKEGKVLLLATEGKEHSILKDVLSQRNRLIKSISRSGQFNSVFYKQDPRMVPTEFNPKCLKVFIQAPQSDEPKPKVKHMKVAKSNKFLQLCQKKDLRHFFKQKVALDDEDKGVFADSPVSKKTTPSFSKSKLFSEVSSLPAKNITVPIDPYNMTPIHLSFPPQKIGINNKIIKKMCKYIRNSTIIKPIETVKVMGSNKLLKESLTFLIEQSPYILNDIWDRMQVLWQNGIDGNNIPLKGIINEDRKIIRAYMTIENSIGSKEVIAKLIQKKRTFPIFPYYSNLTVKNKLIYTNMKHGGIFQNNFEFLVGKFKEISLERPLDEISDDSYMKSMVYEDETDQITYIFDESNRNYSNECFLNSKYISQWGDVLNKTRNSSYVHQSPELNSLNVNDQLKSNPIINESDDDIMFVGRKLQSTPIRKGSHKQLLLNFSQTPIALTAMKRISCKNDILHLGKANKVPTDEAVSSDTISAQYTRIGSELKFESKFNFFDDQFDALITANSGIGRIENSNITKMCHEKYFDVNSKLSTSIRSVNLDQVSTNVPVIEKAKNDMSLLKITSTSKQTGKIALFDVTKKKRLNEIISHHSPQREVETMIEPESRSSEVVHPELADIDINDLSEFSFDENEANIEIGHTTPTPSSPHTTSPDIFLGLCEPISDHKVNESSPLRLITPAVSPCIVSKKVLTWGEIRKKYIKPSPTISSNTVIERQNIKDEVINSDSKNMSTRKDFPNESLTNMFPKIRSKRRIIISDTDTSDDKDFSPIRKKRKSQIQENRINLKSSSKNARLRRNKFIDNEAVLSGSATEDEFEHTIGGYIQDSVVVDDDEAENESSIPMTGIYLQSVRSPCGNIRGAFKIPERRPYNDASKIYSQRFLQDNSSYVADSFVVLSDDESDVNISMSPLERAEKILKIKRRAKRKAIQNLPHYEVLHAVKKKRVLRIHNSSEDDDDFA